MRSQASAALILLLVACGDEGSSYTGVGGAGSGGGGGVSTSSGAGGGGDDVAGAGPSGSGGDTGSGGDDGSAVGTGGGFDVGSGGAGGEDTCPRVRADVPPGTPLNVRPDPSTTNEPVGALQSGAIVDVVAQVQGESIDGNTLWYQIASPGLAGYVFSGFAVCTQDLPPDPPDGFYLPLECGFSTTVTQGNNSGFSHDGDSAYAFDFSLGIGTPMVAMADGIVGYTYAGTQPGDPCYDGGGPECITEANYVVVLHADATQTQYAHLSAVLVEVGQSVTRGERVGLSGSTGYSTGPHAHVQRDDDCGYAFCGSIPLEFVDAGVPVSGQTVTSMNCPR